MNARLLSSCRGSRFFNLRTMVQPLLDDLKVTHFSILDLQFLGKLSKQTLEDDFIIDTTYQVDAKKKAACHLKALDMADPEAQENKAGGVGLIYIAINI